MAHIWHITERQTLFQGKDILFSSCWQHFLPQPIEPSFLPSFSTYSLLPHYPKFPASEKKKGIGTGDRLSGLETGEMRWGWDNIKIGGTLNCIVKKVGYWGCWDR